MSETYSLVGRKFGRSFVFKDGPLIRAGKKRNIRCRTSICLCDCGTIFRARNNALKSGHTKSCGCLNDETRRRLFTTHGRSQTKEYAVWEAMIQRCTNPKCKAYPNWGGRGIRVSKRWRKFENFFKDMGECPAGLSLHRVNNKTGHYNKSNCIWATQKVQARCTRRNLVRTVNGVTACLKELCEIFNKPYNVVKSRWRVYGWSFERAWSEPIRLDRSHPGKTGRGRPRKRRL